MKRSCCAEADAFLDWIERGCFDAMEKGYLKTIVLQIHSASKEENNVLETYSFEISYNDGANVELTREEQLQGDNQNSKLCLSRFIGDAMGNMKSLIESFKNIESEIYLTMRLNYFENRTPNSYIPPLFKPGQHESTINPMASSKIKAGQMKSVFHSMEFEYETVIDKEENISGPQNSPFHKSSCNITEVNIEQKPFDQAKTDNSGKIFLKSAEIHQIMKIPCKETLLIVYAGITEKMGPW